LVKKECRQCFLGILFNYFLYLIGTSGSPIQKAKDLLFSMARGASASKNIASFRNEYFLFDMMYTSSMTPNTKTIPRFHSLHKRIGSKILSFSGNSPIFLGDSKKIRRILLPLSPKQLIVRPMFVGYDYCRFSTHRLSIGTLQ